MDFSDFLQKKYGGNSKLAIATIFWCSTDFTVPSFSMSIAISIPGRKHQFILLTNIGEPTSMADGNAVKLRQCCQYRSRSGNKLMTVIFAGLMACCAAFSQDQKRQRLVIFTGNGDNLFTRTWKIGIAHIKLVKLIFIRGKCPFDRQAMRAIKKFIGLFCVFERFWQ